VRLLARLSVRPSLVVWDVGAWPPFGSQPPNPSPPDSLLLPTPCLPSLSRWRNQSLGSQLEVTLFRGASVPSFSITRRPSLDPRAISLSLSLSLSHHLSLSLHS